MLSAVLAALRWTGSVLLGALRRRGAAASVWLLPVVTLSLALYPHLDKLDTHVVRAHGAWYDALPHIYLCWEWWRSVLFEHGFFDFRWFYPYQHTGTFAELHLVPGMLYGIFDLFCASEVTAFNLAMVAVLALNMVAAYFLLRDVVTSRPLAMIFAQVAAFSPFAWTRYAHPSNTVIFCGLLGLLFLRLAVRTGRWRWCMLAPLMFVLQMYSGLYVGMYFVFVLLLYVPWALGKAREHRVFFRAIGRLALTSALLLPALGYLYESYSAFHDDTRESREYQYVSRKSRRKLAGFTEAKPIDCQLRILGKREKWTSCREELHPGRLAAWGGVVGLIVGALVAARRRRDSWLRSGLRYGAVLLGLRLCVHWEDTLPFHLGLWTALAIPGRRRGGALGLRGEIALPLALVLLMVDVACNPYVELFGLKLQSVFKYFFDYVPGMVGLRSEYRIVVLIPVFLAMIGATGFAHLHASLWRSRHRITSVMLLALLAAFSVVAGQPGWQIYAPAWSSATLPPVLRAARALPEEAILSFVGASGTQVRKRRDDEDAYTMGAVMFHQHRQISGRSTRRPPSVGALRHAQDLRRGALTWSTRVSRLFGATHLILDWGRRRPPGKAQVEAMLRDEPSLRLITMDSRFALLEISEDPSVARGPVPDPPLPGAVIEPIAADASIRGAHAVRAIDGNPWTEWTSGRNQQPGDWIAISFAQPWSLSGVAFTPMNETAALPTKFAIDAFVDGQWREVARKDRWEIPWSLIEQPVKGRVIVPFPEVETRQVRLRVLEASPWNLHVSRFVGFTPRTG